MIIRDNGLLFWAGTLYVILKSLWPAKNLTFVFYLY